MQVFYRAHTISACIVILFSIIHGAFAQPPLIAGFIVYGIDVAYRWNQTSYPIRVDATRARNGKIVSIAIPIEVRFSYLLSSFQCIQTYPSR
jgi:hypothetical protein